MTAYGPLDACPWQGQPENGWLPELFAPLDGVTLGAYDIRTLEWASSTLDWPTLRTFVSLLHRARGAEPLAPGVGDEQIGGDSQTSRIAKPSEHEGDYEAFVEGR